LAEVNGNNVLLTGIIKEWGCFAMEIMGWNQVAD
jgi:hypothetical protein